jgi:hypothetical protein
MVTAFSTGIKSTHAYCQKYHCILTKCNCKVWYYFPNCGDSVLMVNIHSENLRYDVQTLQCEHKSDLVNIRGPIHRLAFSGDTKRRQAPGAVWYTFLRLVNQCSNAVRFLSLLSSIYYHRFGGTVFAMLCITYSVSSALSEIRGNTPGMNMLSASLNSN